MFICTVKLPSSNIEKVVEQLSRFPGVGKKSALRMTMFLLNDDEEDVKRMADSIVELKTKTTFCETCGNVSDAPQCSVCTSVNRNRNLICVVRDFQDIISLENTGQYSGVYHVLGGLISPMDGVGPDDLTISQLLKRVNDEEVDEVVLALSANMEGDTTAFYLARKLEALNVKVSAIARGIAVGGELSYADEITLGRSIQHRTPYKTSFDR